MFENLKRIGINELKKIDAAYASKEEFSEPDLKRLDCLAHEMKNLLAVIGMLEAEEYGYGGVAGARGRDSMGRYVSMDMAPNAGISGHYPMHWGGRDPMEERELYGYRPPMYYR